MKTKKIRIAVAMATDGSEWSAQAWSNNKTPGESASDDEMKFNCLDCIRDGQVVTYMVEVEIPLPEDVDLQGVVVP